MSKTIKELYDNFNPLEWVRVLYEDVYIAEGGWLMSGQEWRQRVAGRYGTTMNDKGAQADIKTEDPYNDPTKQQQAWLDDELAQFYTTGRPPCTAAIERAFTLAKAGCVNPAIEHTINHFEYDGFVYTMKKSNPGPLFGPGLVNWTKVPSSGQTTLVGTKVEPTFIERLDAKAKQFASNFDEMGCVKVKARYQQILQLASVERDGFLAGITRHRTTPVGPGTSERGAKDTIVLDVSKLPLGNGPEWSQVLPDFMGQWGTGDLKGWMYDKALPLFIEQWKVLDTRIEAHLAKLGGK